MSNQKIFIPPPQKNHHIAQNPLLNRFKPLSPFRWVIYRPKHFKPIRTKILSMFCGWWAWGGSGAPLKCYLKLIFQIWKLGKILTCSSEQPTHPPPYFQRFCIDFQPLTNILVSLSTKVRLNTKTHIINWFTVHYTILEFPKIQIFSVFSKLFFLLPRLFDFSANQLSVHTYYIEYSQKLIFRNFLQKSFCRSTNTLIIAVQNFKTTFDFLWAFFDFMTQHTHKQCDMEKRLAVG